MFGWVEAYTTLSMGELDKARHALGQNGIRNHFKCKNMLGGVWGQQSTLGMKMDYATQYYIYVKKADEENAQYLIHKAIHR
jgi:hypothetical protein